MFTFPYLASPDVEVARDIPALASSRARSQSLYSLSYRSSSWHNHVHLYTRTNIPPLRTMLSGLSKLKLTSDTTKLECVTLGHNRRMEKSRKTHVAGKYILSCDGVTIHGVWICNWIYWTLTDPWRQILINVALIDTLYSSLQHTLKSYQPAASSPVVAW
jgi:hypothetical protein